MRIIVGSCFTLRNALAASALLLLRRWAMPSRMPASSSAAFPSSLPLAMPPLHALLQQVGRLHGVAVTQVLRADLHVGIARRPPHARPPPLGAESPCRHQPLSSPRRAGACSRRCRAVRSNIFLLNACSSTACASPASLSSSASCAISLYSSGRFMTFTCGERRMTLIFWMSSVSRLRERRQQVLPVLGLRVVGHQLLEHPGDAGVVAGLRAGGAAPAAAGFPSAPGPSPRCCARQFVHDARGFLVVAGLVVRLRQRQP